MPSSFEATDLDRSTREKSGSKGDLTLKRRPWRRYVTRWSDILEHEYPGSGTPEDPYLVDWMGEGTIDPENPMGWKPVYKWFVTIVAAIATLAVAMASSTLSAATGSIRESFPGYTTQAYVMITSGFVLGFVLGPMVWAPLSELHGRRTLFIFTYILFTIFNGGVIASQNIWTLIILRFLAGTAGSSPLTNAGGTVADLFDSSQRGLGMAVFSSAPFLGPAIGPIAGGFLGATGGWRWVAALVAILSGSLTIVGTLVSPETYAPVLLQKRAKLLSEYTGLVYRYKGAKTEVKAAQLFKVALSKPWKLLFREPIVMLLSLYIAIVYGTLYMLFGAFPIVFQQERGWSPGIGGLAFLGVLVGIIGALAWTILIENPRYSRKIKTEGWLAPEQRLYPAMIGGILLPMVMVFLSIFNYLIDSYLLHAASVLAANSVLRSLFGVAFPLFVSNMYHDLGVNWASTLVGFLALACAPLPILFFVYGPTIRLKSKFAREADEIGQMMRQQAVHKNQEA